MQAIETKYLGPTNHRGARIKVSTDGAQKIVPWDHALGVGANHEQAVLAFVKELGWWGAWVLGGTGRGFVAVCSKSYGFTPNRKSPRCTARVTP